jgi:hypothetical protein
MTIEAWDESGYVRCGFTGRVEERREKTYAHHGPGGYLASSFGAAGRSISCTGASGQPGYTFYDMNADQRPDLVVTRACEDAAVGSDPWHIRRWAWPLLPARSAVLLKK